MTATAEVDHAEHLDFVFVNLNLVGPGTDAHGA